MLVLIWLLALGLAGEAGAHRLDEYLQATLISVERDHVEVEIRLTPGVAVLPVVMAVIDQDHDGRISADEERAYAVRVLKDVVLELDGRAIPMTVAGRSFPSVEDMKQGLGTIQMRLQGERRGGHEIRFVNRHLSGISVYLVNCVLPSTGGLKIERQIRDDRQTEIRFEYSLPAGPPIMLALAFGVGLLGIVRLFWVGRASARSGL